MQNKLAGEKAITNKNSKTTGPIVDKTGKPVKFGFSASGTPQGTQGSLYDPKTRKKVYQRLDKGDYKFKMPITKNNPKGLMSTDTYRNKLKAIQK